MHSVHVFLASPQDLAAERDAVASRLADLSREEAWRGKFTIEIVRHDDRVAPAPLDARFAPQQGVFRSRRRPSQCDVTIVMLWSRLGTPTVGESDAGGHPSGTLAEFEEARGSGTPVFLYRKTATLPPLKPDDPEYLDKCKQIGLVNEFFASLTRPDGAQQTAYTCFETTEQLVGLVATNVASVLRELEDGRAGGTHELRRHASEKTLRLRTPPAPPPWPADPYPLLRPYTHPELFAGRDEELRYLEALVKEPRLILCVHAPSGAGKSSLLQAGLVPRLRDRHYPVHFDRDQTSSGFARRIASHILEMDDDQELADEDAAAPARFARLMTDAHRLAGRPPVIVLDQVDDFLRDGQAREQFLARLGPLLAATMHRIADGSDYPCRWVLCCRRDFQGVVDSWLQNPLDQARRAGRPQQLPTLPKSGLKNPDLYHSWGVPLMGRPEPASDDPFAAAREVFRRAIVTPLTRRMDDGRLRYDERFEDDGADRLAAAFAAARIRRPDDALVPELQTVLSHLRARAKRALGGARVLVVPENREDLDTMIDDALQDHVQRAFERVFPPGSDLEQTREQCAAGLLALRELADAEGRRSTGRPEADLLKALGPAGAAVLEGLAGPDARLVVREQRGLEGAWYVLAHDRLAEVIARAVETGVLKSLDMDRRIVDLRRFVGQRASLFVHSSDEAALELNDEQFDAIERHRSVLVFDDDRRQWWGECEELYTDLDKVLQRRWRTPAGRVRAVERVLGRLSSDPRFRPDAWWLPADDRLGFLEVPGGPFLMGSDPTEDPESWPDERFPGGTSRQTDVGPFFIARWPVTIAQFRAFVEDRDGNGGFTPGYPGCLAGGASHPVTAISWHEARTYCEWLSRKLLAWDATPKDLAERLRLPQGRAWQVRLPSEAEWEKAARGTDGRIYAWPDRKPDPQKANYSASDVGRTSPVGCFPSGASPFGAEDMAGNVWEWTRSLWGKEDSPQFVYPYVRGDGRENQQAPDDVRRVVRGGSFFNTEGGVRAANRDRYGPYSRYDGLGFRVVVSPFQP